MLRGDSSAEKEPGVEPAAFFKNFEFYFTGKGGRGTLNHSGDSTPTGAAASVQLRRWGKNLPLDYPPS